MGFIQYFWRDANSLIRYFEENPSEMNHLRHDGELRTARQQAHLKHVPDYLLPKEGRQALTAGDVGFVPMKRFDRRAGTKRKGGKKSGKAGVRKGDPLKTFKARRKTK
jgi:ATP-dependent RNA helicase DDX56/DBP9